MGENFKGRECGQKFCKNYLVIIKTTMGRYVHVTDDSLSNAVRLFQNNCPVQNGVEMV